MSTKAHFIYGNEVEGYEECIESQTFMGKHLGYNAYLVWDKEHIHGIELKDDPEGYDPIPINREWLLKLGFEEFPKNYLYLENYNYSFVCYYTCSGSSWTFELNGLAIGIKYVHELQNIYYAIIGEEL